MNKWRKLIRLNKYLSSFRIDFEGNKIAPILTTAQADATAKLAYQSGTQILIARPESTMSGEIGLLSEEVSTAFFILEKAMTSERTDELETEQYDRLLELSLSIIERIVSDTEGGCDLLPGMVIKSANLTPESSLFGGWTGYSIEIRFS